VIDPVQAFLEANSLRAQAFPPTSRYSGLGTATVTLPDGRTVAYTRRRLVPQPGRFALLRSHTVTEGDRLDNLAHRYLGDPEQYWRLCDANGALRPDSLVETVGDRIRITLPEGMGGPSNG
jgi:hypothetical protein